MIADLSRQRPFGRQSLIYLSSGPSQKMFVDPNTDNTNLKCFIPKGLFKLWMLFYIRLYKGVLTCLRVPSCSWGSWWQWLIQECTPAIKLYRTKYTHTHTWAQIKLGRSEPDGWKESLSISRWWYSTIIGECHHWGKPWEVY